MGAPADVLEQYESDEDASDANGIVQIEVLECNWNAVTVFCHCEPQWLAGMAAARKGIPAAEIRAVVLLLRIARNEWPQILADVQYMGKVAASVNPKE